MTNNDRDELHRPAPGDAPVIADGRGRLLTGRHPTLSVDGRWCDFTATNDLVEGDLVRPAWPAPIGSVAPAVLTHGGTAALAALSAPIG